LKRRHRGLTRGVAGTGRLQPWDPTAVQAQRAGVPLGGGTRLSAAKTRAMISKRQS
jgi:hypothetical protein